MPTLADLLRNDPWGAPPSTPLAQTVNDVGFDPSLGFAGAVQTYLSRLKKMQGGLAQDMLDTAADPNAEGIQRAANLLGGLGLKVANVPMALMPSSQELRDRGYAAGASPEVQAIGGALGDAVNIPEPASVGTLLAGLAKTVGGVKAAASVASPLLHSMAVAPAAKEAGSLADGIIAYHGSPHSFDKFDMSKIGTGEGAQAYGHGLYFAHKEDVAKQYREMLADRLGSTPAISQNAFDIIDEIPGSDQILHTIDMSLENAIINQQRQPSWQDVKDIVSRRYGDSDAAKRTISALEADGWPEKFNKKNGSMYQVHLNVQPHELLDWDKPLSEQPKAVRDAFIARNPGASDWWEKNKDVLKGESMTTAFSRFGTSASKAQKDATEALKAAGVKGIRYKDAGSRGGEGGTSNFVIFDDKLITILKKYGIPMTAGAGGAMLVAGANMPPDIAAQLQQQ